MSTSALNRSKLVTGPEQLPLFSLPDCRRDRRMHLARLFWHISYLDACPNGCQAGNGFLSNLVGVSKDHLRDLRRELEERNLAASEIKNSNERTIRPLVGLVALLRAGWVELAWVIAEEIQKAPAALKRMAASLLKNRGPRVDLAKLCRGLKAEEAPKSTRKSSPSLRGNLRGLSSYKECNEETTTKQTPETQNATSAPQATPEPQAAEVSAAALLLTQKGNLPNPEALSLSKTLTQLGGTVGSIRHALDVMLSRPNIANRGGFLVGAIKAAVAGNPYLLPSSAAPAHPTDSASYRPVDIVREPEEDRKRREALEMAEKAQREAAVAAWEALGESGRAVWVDRALAEVLPTLKVGTPAYKAVKEQGIEHKIVKAMGQRLFSESQGVTNGS